MSRTRLWRPMGLVVSAACALGWPAAALAQTASQRGLAEVRGIVFAQEAPGDSARALGAALFRYEASTAPTAWLGITGGIDLRADSRGNVERGWRLDWEDRSLLRPPASVRRLSAVVSRGGLTVELGKQFVRWGKADIVNPTDRFAPRDFLEVVVNELTAVTGARLTYERGGKTIDLVWTPRMTPSRLPRPGLRWSVARPVASFVAVADGGRELPSGGQAGARWSHVAGAFEYSLSVFDGYDHLPVAEQRFRPSPPAIEVVRVFPRIRSYGAEAVYPLRWVTLKAEASRFGSGDRRADEYISYVVQAERQAGEWLLVGGYAGERVGRRGSAAVFAPDRGLADSFLARANLTIDANQSAVFEAAIRRNGDGALVKAEYSRALGGHWRATAGAVLIGGSERDFLGQFRRNSHLSAALRCSF